MDVSVSEAATAERGVLAQLLELNEYEFSRIDSRAIGPDGRYGYRYLDAYWSEPGRNPYLLRVGEEIAGFALVSRLTDGVLSIAEFLVLPKFRRSGVGTRAAQTLFQLHPGTWRVAQVSGNGSATEFWRRAIPVSFSEAVDGEDSVIQQFAT